MKRGLGPYVHRNGERNFAKRGTSREGSVKVKKGRTKLRGRIGQEEI